jgi:hypothetical protein
MERTPPMPLPFKLNLFCGERFSHDIEVVDTASRDQP